MSILDTPMDHSKNALCAISIRHYLVQLMYHVWYVGERFDGKRPFGSSAWKYDVYTAMIKAGVIDGKLDEDGYVDKCDTRNADKLILDAIALEYVI